MIGSWTELGALQPGDHLHLDGLMSDPPVPGSVGWLPVIEEVAEFLVGCPGRWTVRFVAGCSAAVPAEEISHREAMAWVEEPEQSQPPDVWRLFDHDVMPTWEGDHRQWTSTRSDGVVAYVSFTQTPDERVAGEGWTVAIGFDVNR
ncbi:MAG: hypothetical protein JWL72_4003 [Ilumatobacteraceae bacterium]|nr:hypothetical protein [Ilumatobacteraceae bacterium]